MCYNLNEMAEQRSDFKKGFKKRFLLHLGISVLIVVGLGIILIFLGWDINKRVANISKIRQDIAVYNQKAESLTSLKVGSEKANRYTSVLGNIIPNEEGLFFLDGELNKLAKDNSLDLSFNFGEETKGAENQVGSIDFSMTARSSLINLVKFFTDVENMRYFFQLSRFEITRQGEAFKLSSEGRVFARL